MSNDQWIEAVENARKGNESLFNKVVTSNFKQHFYTPILQITKDKGIVEEIYILSITKFWERFVLWGEELPQSNIKGYIFQMARNAFFEVKRKQSTIKASSMISVDATKIFETYGSYVCHNEPYIDTPLESDQDVLLKSVFEAMGQLDPLCNDIIEKNILENNLLKTVKEEMALSGTYNSIVKKKKRCIKKLKELLETHIYTNSATLQMNTNDA